MTLIVETLAGVLVRRVPNAPALRKDVEHGETAEEAVHDAAAIWGLPDFVKWYRRKGRQLALAPTQKQVDRFREVSEPLIAAMGEALDDATEFGNARRGYAACALTDVLHAQFELALARFKAGELDYANEVEDVLRKVPEQRRQISELEDR